jgi:serine/threonine-protein kinase
VLPFSDMSPGRDHEWFCEGIAEEILNSLTRLPGLRVATRTSAFRFGAPRRDLAHIGETLGVTTLLEGSVRTAGPRLRVTAQLVNASDGFQIWSQRFEGQMKDVFEIQDEIAQRVVEALELRLGSASDLASPARHTDDLEAYHLFLKGRHFRYTKLDLRNALRTFEQAVERDPSYGLARLAAAETLAVLGIYGMVPHSEAQDRAREEIRRARETDGESAAAWAVEALLRLVHDWDPAAALVAFDRALDLDPASVPCRAWRTWSLLAVDRDDEAVDEARRIVELDPQSPYANSMAGLTFLMAGRADEAVERTRRGLEIEPASLQATWMLGVALAGREDWEEAGDWLERAVERSGRAPAFLGFLAWCEAAAGRRAQARERLAEMERRSGSEYVSPLFFAIGVSELGEPAKMRTLLEQAFEERAGLLALPKAPWMRTLRREPSLEDLQRRLRGISSVPR